MPKHTILFLSADPLGMDRLALGEEVRDIQAEIERSGHGNQFELITRWAMQPMDLLRVLRKLKPTIVHFSGHGSRAVAEPHRRVHWDAFDAHDVVEKPKHRLISQDAIAQLSGHGPQQAIDTGNGPRRDVVVTGNAGGGGLAEGLYFLGDDGGATLVTTAAVEETFRAAGSTVRLVVLSACYSDAQAAALVAHVDAVIGMAGAIGDASARAFAIGLYGGLGEGETVAAAFRQGCAALSLGRQPEVIRPQLRARVGINTEELRLTEISVAGPERILQEGSNTRPIPEYPSAEIESLSKRLKDARSRREKLREAGATSDLVDREILDIRRQLREGGQLRAGDSLGDGRYLLVRTVGRGGFAVVWEAFDHAEQRRVAIKVLHSNLAGDPQQRERFFRGSRAMMNLRNHAVVNILDAKGQDDSFHYFVMELMVGGNLRDAVLSARLEKLSLLAAMLQIGEALAAVHSRGYIHRDIKPSNILLDESGRAKLADFDLVGSRDTTGGTGTSALGTVVYAAPECLDRPQEATARADVFGFGMTAIFCISGQDLSLLTFRNPERTIAALDCPESIRSVLRRAVAWESSDRFDDASTMLVELRNALNDWDLSTRFLAPRLGNTPSTMNITGSAPSNKQSVSTAEHDGEHTTMAENSALLNGIAISGLDIPEAGRAAISPRRSILTQLALTTLLCSVIGSLYHLALRQRTVVARRPKAAVHELSSSRDTEPHRTPPTSESAISNVASERADTDVAATRHTYKLGAATRVSANRAASADSIRSERVRTAQSAGPYEKGLSEQPPSRPTSTLQARASTERGDERNPLPEPTPEPIQLPVHMTEDHGPRTALVTELAPLPALPMSNRDVKDTNLQAELVTDLAPPPVLNPATDVTVPPPEQARTTHPTARPTPLTNMPSVAASAVTKISGKLPAFKASVTDAYTHVSAKLCIDELGQVISVKLLLALPEIQDELQRQFSAWRFKQYFGSNGQALPVCFIVTHQVALGHDR